MYKDFDLQSCEKYELRTRYLSRWNYMFKNFDEMSEQEVEQAINKGYEEESAWVKRCEPNLTSFIPKDWKECTCEKENSHYQNCKQLILDKVQNNRLFSDAFSNADRHGKNYKNGEQYVY